MTNHVIVTLPSGNKSCYGEDVALAFARAQQLFPFLGTIELASYRVEDAEWNDGRVLQHPCPAPDCKVGTPNKDLNRYKVYDHTGRVLHSTSVRSNARRFARSYNNHPSTSTHASLWDSLDNIFLPVNPNEKRIA